MLLSFRFGTIIDVATITEGTATKLKVEFASRYEAEQAVKKGGHFGGEGLELELPESVASSSSIPASVHGPVSVDPVQGAVV